LNTPSDKSKKKSSQFGIKWHTSAIGLYYDVNLLGNSISNIKENKETLSEVSRDTGNQNRRIANESFINVAKFKYFGMPLTNQNDIHDEIKIILNSGNACYYSVQNLHISYQKNLKIKIYKTVVLLVVLYGCETWSLILREEHRLRVFENRVLRRIFGPKREEDRSWRKLHNDELRGPYSSLTIVRMIKSRMRWAGHAARIQEGRGVYRVLIDRPKGKRPLGRTRHRWKDNNKLVFRKIGISRTNRFRWLRIRSGGGLL
jgi:hypothetical protein